MVTILKLKGSLGYLSRRLVNIINLVFTSPFLYGTWIREKIKSVSLFALEFVANVLLYELVVA